MTTSPRIAVCPGTYDPITNGHLDIITRAASTFDEVVVAVVQRPHRKVTTLFSLEERLQFIQEATSALTNVRVETFGNLIVEFAREVGAQAIVKGLRAISDFEYELEMFQMNRHVAPEIDTFYLMASPRFSFLSSSGVKELAAFNGSVDGLVAPNVAQRLQEELGTQRN